MKVRLGKVEIYIGFELVLALTAVLLLDSENRIICCILSAFLHELGHLAVMATLRVRVRSISLRLFDVLIKADEPKSDRDDVLITLGGVAVNFICALIFAPVSRQLCLSNLALGVFNSLPVMSLDGGHLLTVLLHNRYDEMKCERILRITTFLFILPLMTGGIYLLLHSGYNYSLLAVALYLLAILLLKK